MSRYFLFTVYILCLATSQSKAQDTGSTGNFMLAPTIFYNSEIRTRNSNDEESHLLWELRMAYQVQPAFYIGMFYQNEEERSNTSGYADTSLNVSTTGIRTGWGPVVGYVTNSFHATLAYHFSSQWKLNTAGTSGNTEYLYTGAGFQVDVGYKIPLWAGFFGPQLSYKNYSYPKLKTGNASEQNISPDLKESKFDPSLVYYFFF